MTFEFRVRRKKQIWGGIVREGREDAKTLKLVQEVLHQLRHSPYAQESYQLPNAR